MDSDKYRLLHEASVSNNTGTTTSEIFLATLVIPVSALLSLLLLPALLPKRYAELQYSSRVWLQMGVELCTILLPVLFSFTVFADNIFLLFSALVVSILTLCSQYMQFKNSRASLSELLESPSSTARPSFLTNYRAGMILATAVCILAVDFPVFPRKFAKTETYGYGLMDVGVGSFVISSGLVSRSSAWKFRTTFPIFLLGIVRLVSVKALNYNEHATEYGVHWNFFFTLAVTSIVGPSLLNYTNAAILVPSALGVYHVLLKSGLEDWILGPTPRSGFISSNREGIFSLFGYLALYWMSTEVGRLLRTTSTTFKNQLKLFCTLAAISLAGHLGLPYLELLFGETSRRLANIAYCVWMMSFNVGILAGCLGADLVLTLAQYLRDKQQNVSEKSFTVFFREPYLFRVINFNGLLFFLFANLFTGLVNLFFQPMLMSTVQSLVILTIYCVTISVPVAVLYIWKIKV